MRSQERMRAATLYIPRTLNANINPAFTNNSRHMRSESHRKYKYVDSPPNKQNNLKNH